ncbi:hypothetical protein HZC33_02700 [Candidatus Wolfebacteria bacterium]|nr:hypothetical protein [Candidatus Wolfebacteria bacterium]
MIIIYLLKRFVFRVKEFLRHWYINSFFVWSHFIISIFEKLDKAFALKITWRHFFEPLYQDRTFLGYFLGFIFRSGRLILGILVYLPLFFLAVLSYLIWLIIPFYIIYQI